MKRLMAVLLMVCFFTMAFSGIALAAYDSPTNPVYAVNTSHHSSFWVHTGKYIVGTAVICWIVDGLSHKDKAKPVTIIELKPDTVIITPIP